MTVKRAIVSTIDRMPGGPSLLASYERLRGREPHPPEKDHTSQIAELHHKIGILEAQLVAANYYATRGHWRSRVLCRELFGEPVPCPVPPKEIPPELLERYTMGGKVPIDPVYMDGTYPANWPLIYTDEEIDAYMAAIRRGETYIYGSVDTDIQEAFRRYPIAGLDVVNMGSMTPWYEAMEIVYGGRPSTIDYNPIITRSARVKTLTTAEWERDKPRFDYALSISSFEHDGLGAYGDPLDPDGDLKAMRRMKDIIKPGGIMLFAVPTGRDRIMFNQSRIYGRLRMPLMLDGWDMIDSINFSEQLFDTRGDNQPVLVLRNV